MDHIKVNIPTVDNTKQVCSTIVLSTCVTMKRDSPAQLNIMDGETINSTLDRMNATINSLRNRIAASEVRCNTLDSELESLRRQIDSK